MTKILNIKKWDFPSKRKDTIDLSEFGSIKSYRPVSRSKTTLDVIMFELAKFVMVIGAIILFVLGLSMV